MTARYLITTLAILSLAGCAGPARTETTTTSSVEHPEGGGEIRHTSTETVETAHDGSQTSDLTETTRTETPPE